MGVPCRASPALSLWPAGRLAGRVERNSLRIRAAGVHIALFGGFLASLALAASGLASWILSDPAIGDSARTMQLASFAAGGPAFAVGFGLLAAGVSVTAGLSAKIPRWAMWLGLCVAAAGELSTLSLLFLPAALLIPLTRFPGLVWVRPPCPTTSGPSAGVQSMATRIPAASAHGPAHKAKPAIIQPVSAIASPNDGAGAGASRRKRLRTSPTRSSRSDSQRSRIR
jgi:hypothetical protein